MTVPSAASASLNIHASDKPLERLPARFEQTQAQIVPIEAQKVERHVDPRFWQICYR